MSADELGILLQSSSPPIVSWITGSRNWGLSFELGQGVAQQYELKLEVKDLTGTMLRGSVLGLLFIIYISDLVPGVNSDISEFADDIKIGGVIKYDQEDGILQNKLYS